jgi:hypothetical protein
MGCGGADSPGGCNEYYRITGFGRVEMTGSGVPDGHVYSRCCDAEIAVLRTPQKSYGGARTRKVKRSSAVAEIARIHTRKEGGLTGYRRKKSKCEGKYQNGEERYISSCFDSHGMGTVKKSVSSKAASMRLLAEEGLLMVKETPTLVVPIREKTNCCTVVRCSDNISLSAPLSLRSESRSVRYVSAPAFVESIISDDDAPKTGESIVSASATE